MPETINNPETITDYESIIDEQTWQFIRQTDSWYPPDTIDFSLERQREIYDKMCRQFHRGYPEGVVTTDSIIQSDEYGIPVRRYTSNAKKDCATIIYFHGGGFIVGGLNSHDDICAELCNETGFDVTSVDYRLAPEHLHPAAFNDALACVVFEFNRIKKPLILCGDSAGGNLAAAVSHTARDSAELQFVELAGQVLIYPGLGGDDSRGSYIRHAKAPMLTTRDVHFYSTIRTGHKSSNDQSDDEQTDTSLSTNTLAPLQDKNFSNLPPTVAFSAECDPLADDSRDYVDSIKHAGGEATWINEAGLVHGYLRARSTVDRARHSFDRIIEAIKQLGLASTAQ